MCEHLDARPLDASRPTTSSARGRDARAGASCRWKRRRSTRQRLLQAFEAGAEHRHPGGQHRPRRQDRTTRRTSQRQIDLMARMAEKAASVRRDALREGARRRVHLQHADHAAGDGEDHVARRSASTWTPATSTAPARTRWRRCSRCISRVQHVHIRDCKGRGPAPGDPADQACGRGDIDLFGYCRVMVDGGYDGPGVPRGHRREARARPRRVASSPPRATAT